MYIQNCFDTVASLNLAIFVIKPEATKTDDCDKHFNLTSVQIATFSNPSFL